MTVGTPRGEGGKSSSHDRHTTILIVEDSNTQRERLSHILAQRGYRVRAAADAEEALSLLEEETPALIISDVMMPKMDGWAFCRQVKNDERFRDVPVMLLTSLSDPQDIIQGLECGADNFVVKPYEASVLPRRVEYLLANASFQQTERAEMGLQLYLGGRKHLITSHRRQMLDLLISTFENAVEQNRKLQRTKQELMLLNRELERRVEERTQELLHAQKMEVIGQLASGVVHDFNNLFTAIAGFAEMIEQSLPADDLNRDLAREILNAARSGADMTRQLLVFSRRQSRQTEQLDLSDLVCSLEKIITRLTGSKVQVEIVCRDRPLLVTADAAQIEQVVLNLALNARDAMPAGGRLRIEVRQRDRDGRGKTGSPGHLAEISVQDEGEGIPPHLLGKIFDPFFTTKDSGKGTGLGLAIVQRIIKQHGGDIVVKSELGKGSTFAVRLPSAEA